MIASWTSLELDIVDVLTRRVRLMSLVQIGQIWWPHIGSQKTLRRGLKRLRDGGLVERAVISAHPRLIIRSPIVAWQPSSNDPNLRAITEQLRARWKYRAEPTEVYWASTKAANLFGSTAGKLPDVSHRDHDLLLSEVYVFYRRHRPDLVHRWAGEQMFQKAGFRIKDPDAFLFDDSGNPMRVVESAGKYGLLQVESFHQHCVDHELPYELW